MESRQNLFALISRSNVLDQSWNLRRIEMVDTTLEEHSNIESPGLHRDRIGSTLRLPSRSGITYYTFQSGPFLLLIVRLIFKSPLFDSLYIRHHSSFRFNVIPPSNLTLPIQTKHDAESFTRRRRKNRLYIIVNDENPLKCQQYLKNSFAR